MQIRCPNCEQSFSPEESSADERYACTACGRLIYVDGRGLFPPVSAMTYPGQGLSAQILKSFFFVAEAQAPAPALPSELPVPSLGTASLQPDIEPPPYPSVAAPAFAVEEALGQGPPPPPDMPKEEMSLQAVAGGTFEAPLPAGPPPLKAAHLGGLVPPPWEQPEPPPLAKEEWAIATPGGPPQVERAREADEFARALGLPSLDAIGVHEPAKHSRAAPAAETESEEKRSRAWMYYGVAVVLLLTGGAVFAGLKMQKPVLVEEVRAPAAATQPVEQPALPVKAAIDSHSAARALAVDHYSRGSKLYLQKKLPAAVDEFKKALDADAGFGLAHRGLGVVYASQGKGDLAIKEYKTYLKVSPDAKDAKQVEQLIKNFEK